MLLDFHFLFFHRIYFMVIVFFALFLFWVLFRYRQKLIFSSEMILRSSLSIYWLKTFFFCLSLVFSIFALMDPVGNGQYPESKQKAITIQSSPQTIELKRKAHNIYFLIDASASMNVPDARLEKSRLNAAKDIVDEIIAQLTGETIALDTFTSDLTEISPPTNDYLFVRLMLNQVQINEGGIPGTDFGSTLSAFTESNFKRKKGEQKTLILLSDGEDNTLSDLTAEKKQEKIKSIADLFREAGLYNWRVYTIGIGSLEGGIVPGVDYDGKSVQSKLEEPLLQTLANTGRGQFYAANDYTSGDLASRIATELSKYPAYYKDTEKELESTLLQNLVGNNGLIYTSYFQIPVGFAALLLALYLFLPHFTPRGVVLLFLFFSAQLYSDEDPREKEMVIAKAYVGAKMYEEAAAIYKNLLHESSGAKEDAALKYNLGTVYLLLQQWKAAIQQLIAIDKNAMSPYLTQNVHKNLALAFYFMGVNEEETLTSWGLFKLALQELNHTSKNVQQPLRASIDDALGKIDPQAHQQFEEAFNGLKSFDAKKVEESSSQDILQALIDQQQYLLWMNIYSLDPASAESKETHQLLVERQEELGSLIEPYLHVLYNEQEQHFKTQGVCQFSPWDTALPLVMAGDRTALAAADLLKEKAADFIAVSTSQKTALDSWKKAMEAIKNPSAKKSSCFGESNSASVKDLSTLLKMQAEDIPQPVQPTISKTVKKPW